MERGDIVQRYKKKIKNKNKTKQNKTRISGVYFKLHNGLQMNNSPLVNCDAINRNQLELADINLKIYCSQTKHIYICFLFIAFAITKNAISREPIAQFPLSFH